jgi:hypothetical protein
MPTLKSTLHNDVEVMHNYILTNDFMAKLVEEVGEVGRALQGEGKLAEELIQVASFCVRWLENIQKK